MASAGTTHKFTNYMDEPVSFTWHSNLPREDGEQVTDLYTIQGSFHFQEVLNWFIPTRCEHSYSPCGRWYQGAPFIKDGMLAVPYSLNC